MYLATGILSVNNCRSERESLFVLAKDTVTISLPRFHCDPDRSLYLFSEDNMLRNTAKYIVGLNLFEVVIQLTILANCAVLALESHLPQGDRTALDLALEKFELVFLIIFTIEAVLKVVASGFIMGQQAYLRSVWNILDFAVIIVGIIGSMFSGFDQRVVGALRALRPLKLIYTINSLQIVMKSLFRAMQPLLQISILILFVILMFSIIGLEFYSGKFHYACFRNNSKEPFDNGKLSSEVPCSPDNSTKDANLCSTGFTCRTYWIGPFYGTINFDNILFAMLTVFQCVTMEGWTDILYLTNQATGTSWNYVYYVSLVLVGSFFMLNLILGVLSGEFAKERQKVEKRQTFLIKRQDMILQEEINGYLDWIDTSDELILNGDCVTEEQRKKIFKARKRAQKMRQNNDGQSGSEYLGQFNIDEDIIKNLRKDKNKWWKCVKSGCFNCCPIIYLVRLETRRLLKSQICFWCVIVLVTLNIVILATEYYHQPPWLDYFHTVSEYIFLGLFSFEMILKMFALGFSGYFHSNFNTFDFWVVLASAAEITWQYIRPNSSFGISAVRTVRILRLFKVTRYWSSMRLLMISLLNSLKSIFSLLFLLFLFLFIFAILGMQLFGGSYTFDEGLPKQNFDSFFNAMLTVFEILTGENWNEAMYNGIRSQMTKTSEYHMLYSFYFVFIVVFGNYTLLNVFLAIAVDNIGNIQEVAQEEADKQDDLESIFGKKVEIPSLIILPMEDQSMDKEYRFKTIKEEIEATCEPYNKSKFVAKPKLGQPMSPYSSLYVFGPTNWIRKLFHFIVNLEHFETFIILIILASSISLASENVVNEQATINIYFSYVDYAFTVVFAAECLLKIVDMGLILHPKAYLRSIWNIIDLFVVIFSILYLTLNSNRNTLKSLRVIRVMRPLKTVQKIRKLKEVFQTVIQSIKNVFSILLIYSVFQFIFAVMAVQLFSGRFFYCNDEAKLTYEKCRGFFIDYGSNMEAVVIKRVWQRFCFHYDSVLDALITLFTVTTSEGWLSVLRHSIDATYINMGPIYNFRVEAALFYVIYFVIFPFFFVNIFVALTIITFQDQGGKSFSKHGLNKNQKFCIDFAVTAKPRERYVPSNKDSLRYRIWRLVVSTPFEIFILMMIALNTIVLTMRYYRRKDDIAVRLSEDSLLTVLHYNNYQEALNYLNISFIIIFIVECILKMIAFNPKNYFKNLWNVFDFVTVFGSITDALIGSLRLEGIVRYVPNIGVLKLFRAARLIKLLVKVYGIRIIMWTFVQSFKSLPYVVLLILMLFYIYAIIGMQLFGNVIVKTGTPIHIYNNFQTLGSSMLLLFRCATGENWQEIMVACEEGQECHGCNELNCSSTSCGSDLSYIYFISFSFLTTFLMLNLFIAVLMENFDYLTRDISILGPHHLDQFIEKWSFYDPLATGQIHYTDVYDLLMKIEPPVGFGKKCPYRTAYKKLIRMNMPVKEGKVHFTTTLMALIREALKIKKGNPEESDILDMELRWCISDIWPDFAKKSLNLLIPSCIELSHPNLTVGKIYICLWIYENWRTFKAATRGRRRQIRHMDSGSSRFSDVDLSDINDFSGYQSVDSFRMSAMLENKTSLGRQSKAEGEKLSKMMYDRLQCYIQLKSSKIVTPDIQLHPQISTLERPGSEETCSTATGHWDNIISQLSRVYKLDLLPKHEN